ncbi:4-hydroxy-tetrahydrodipicolinate reductase [Elusimicrobium posterum]|uniref:4-hydroxy-tetrahydrodipicolinate reductase n=1 Tax=Elusimicrobium posterum TaxID=3116653 RepID=UPI003C711027
MKKVLIHGANGRMGKMIADIIKSNPDKGLEVSVLRDIGLEGTGEFDIVIDFSLPEGAQKAFEIAKQGKAAFLTGVTNLPEEFINKLKAETEIPVFYSPNVSIGVYVFTQILKHANTLLSKYDKSMEEIHHIHKKDAPSGTAKSLAAAVGFPAEKVTALRIGETVGTHSMTFSSEYEDFTFTHKAKTRALFAESAVFVAAWLVNQKPGFYSMQNYVESI